MNAPIRILIVDDHAIFRLGVAELLQDEADMEVVGQADNAGDAPRLNRLLNPDIVLMDVHMPGIRGYDAIPDLKRDRDVRVLMLTVSERDEDLLAALAAGADGYLLKNAEPQELTQAVRKTVAGEAVLSGKITAQVMRAAVRGYRADAPTPLSPREQEVLQLLAGGASTADMAAALVISESTVKTHVRHILEKLEASTRAEAVARAAELGWLGDAQRRG